MADLMDVSHIRRIVYGPDDPRNTPTNINGDEPNPDDDLTNLLIDWPACWDNDHTEADWLAEPIIPAKRSVALFAPGGEGKSLLALWLAANLATGRPIFGHTNPPINVLYLDYEQTEDDLHERLESMGYGPDVDLSRLHYALLPSLPGLDQPEGGKAVVRLAHLVSADLVIVDTFGRAVHGDENEADTVRAWYRWTGLHLKAEGRGFVRVDHAGKDLTKGQRGSSAKNDDVDIVWQMTKQDAGVFKLTAKKRRMGWVPETVELKLDQDDDLTYNLLTGISYPAGTAELAKALDALNVSPLASMRAALHALREAGRGSRRPLVSAAQKYRRLALESDPRKLGITPRPKASGSPSGPPCGNSTNPQVDPSGVTAGITRDHPPAADGDHPVSLIRGSPAEPRHPDPFEDF